MVSNKNLQEILKAYVDEYIICVDKAFDWDKSKELVDPHLFIDTDNGQIEILGDEIKDLDFDTTFKIISMYNELSKRYNTINNETLSNVIAKIINIGYKEIEYVSEETINYIIKRVEY